MSTRLLGLLSVPVLCTLAAGPAGAGLITFSFCGTVDTIDNFSVRPAPFNTVNLGDSWTLSYTFDDAAADTNPGNPNQGWYDPAIVSYASAVGSVLLNRLVPGDTDMVNSIIHVASNQNVGDGYFVYLPFSTNGPNGPVNARLDIWLQDYTGTVWNGDIPRDGLKTTLSLSDFQSARFKFAFPSPNGGGSLVNMIEGRIDCFSVVPSPGSVAVLGVIGLVGSRRRRA